MTRAKLIVALAKAALAIPHALAPGETKEEFEARIQQIAETDADAALAHANGKGWTAFELGLSVVVLQGNESGGFDKRVHAGEQHPVWDQDKGLARCLGQLHETKDQKGNPAGPVPRSVWEKLAGLDLDSTALCARVTTQMLVSHANQCGVFLGRRANKGLVAQAFASYAYGGKCIPEDREWKRAQQWEALLGRFGEKPDVPGYHRLPLSHLPPAVQHCANVMKAMLQPQDKPGDLFCCDPMTQTGDRYKVRLERHAEGKIGFSAFQKD